MTKSGRQLELLYMLLQFCMTTFASRLSMLENVTNSFVGERPFTTPDPTDPNLWVSSAEWGDDSPAISKTTGLRHPVKNEEQFWEECLADADRYHQVCRTPDLSCSDRCGVGDVPGATTFNLTCFCDSLCLLYGDCCADFREQCPEEVAEYKQDFSYMGNVESICSDKGYRVISSCENFQEDSRMDIDVKDIRSDVMITDNTTGIAYVNYTVFACNAKPYAVPRMWRQEIAIPRPDSTFDVSSAVVKFNEIVTISHPPEGFSPRPCVEASNIRCVEPNVEPCWELSLSNLSDFCFNVSEYVTNNEIGAYNGSGTCFIGNVIRQVRSNLPFSFAVTMSLAESDQSFVLSASPDGDFPWEEVTCKLREEPGTPLCENIKCSQGYFFSGASCMVPHSLDVTFTFRGVSSQIISQLLYLINGTSTAFGPDFVVNSQGGMVDEVEGEPVYIETFKINEITLKDTEDELPVSSNLRQELQSLQSDILRTFPARIQLCFVFRLVTYYTHTDGLQYESTNEEVGRRCDVFDTRGSQLQSISVRTKTDSLFSVMPGNSEQNCNNGGSCGSGVQGNGSWNLELSLDKCLIMSVRSLYLYFK